MKLIKASFIHAKYRGFTDQAIAAACQDLELPTVTAAILENGPYDVVTFAMDQWLREMKEDIQSYSVERVNENGNLETVGFD